MPPKWVALGTELIKQHPLTNGDLNGNNVYALVRLRGHHSLRAPADLLFSQYPGDYDRDVLSEAVEDCVVSFLSSGTVQTTVD